MMFVTTVEILKLFPELLGKNKTAHSCGNQGCTATVNEEMMTSQKMAGTQL